MNGHIEVTKLLLDRGAVIDIKDKVSDKAREIVMTVCVIEGVIMTASDSCVIVKSSSQRQHQ